MSASRDIITDYRRAVARRDREAAIAILRDECGLALTPSDDVFSFQTIVEHIAEEDEALALREAQREIEREREDRRDAAIESLCRDVEAALGVSLDWRGYPSRYAVYRGIEVRVSDHPQPPCGSARVRETDAGLEATRWLADVSFITSEPIDRGAIRSRVAAALHSQR